MTRWMVLAAWVAATLTACDGSIEASCPQVEGTWSAEGLMGSDGSCTTSGLVDLVQTDCDLSIQAGGSEVFACTFEGSGCSGEAGGADQVLDFPTDDSGTWTTTVQIDPFPSCTATLTPQ
jgi:hypothetical protein